MKKENLFFALILTLVFNACSPSDLFTGDYSYKTSAAVNFYNDTTNLDILLPNVLGQMDIIKLGSDSVLIVRSSIMGDVSTTTASIINDSIYLQSYHKNLNVTYNDSIRSVDVLVSGCGKLYDKHIVIDESYSGIMSVPDTIYIRSKNVLTVAELNK